MRHILRHGHGQPTTNDLKPWQLGINEDDNKLYIRTGDTDDDIHELNSDPTLEQQEIRTWRFTADNIDDGKNITNSETQLIRGMTDFPVDINEDVKIYAEHTGWNVTRLKIQFLIKDENAETVPFEYIPEDGLLELFTIKGDPTLGVEDGKAILNVSEQINEWIVSISETYALKISVYKTKEEEGDEIPTTEKQYQSLIVIESIGYLSQGEIVL